MKASNHPALAAPLITIVTATFNAAKQLPHTLESLREQTSQMKGRWEIGRPALPPHGACFHHRSLLDEQTAFDTRYQIAADSKLLLGAIRRAPPVYVDCVVVGVPIGGVSFRLGTARAVAAEVKAINRELGIRVPLSEQLAQSVRLGMLDLLRMVPERLAHRLADRLRTATGRPVRWSV